MRLGVDTGVRVREGVGRGVRVRVRGVTAARRVLSDRRRALGAVSR
jgi:hypothetical protein